MERKILVSITGRTPKEWQDKLQEINQLDIKEVALFLEFYSPEEKQKIYHALLASCVESIPLVHVRHDMTKYELAFLKDHFKTKYFTCHEENFVNHDVDHWKGFYKNLYLEMNFDNVVSKKVEVEKIGGFCIDLAHFKVSYRTLSRDFAYVFDRKNHHIFACNHLNGWNAQKNIDVHTLHNLQELAYLKTLPNFVFGKCIALEMFNSIAEQLEYKKYLEEFL